MVYVYRIIIKGKFKDFEKIEELMKFIEREISHPCFVNIRSFETEENVVKKMGFCIKR
jgi:hypothetical protein